MLLQLLLILLILNYIIAFYFIITEHYKLKDCISLLLPYMIIIIYVTAFSLISIIYIIDFIDGITNKEN